MVQAVRALEWTRRDWDYPPACHPSRCHSWVMAVVDTNDVGVYCCLGFAYVWKCMHDCKKGSYLDGSWIQIQVSAFETGRWLPICTWLFDYIYILIIPKQHIGNIYSTCRTSKRSCMQCRMFHTTLFLPCLPPGQLDSRWFGFINPIST